MSKKVFRGKIKAILFDLGRVVIHFDFKPAFKRLAKICNASPREIEEAFLRSGLEVLYDGGKISSRQFHRRVKKALKHRLAYGRFAAIWNDIFTPNPAVWALVKRLASSHRLVLLSNTNAMHYEYARRRYPVLRRFHQHVLSFKERVRKPDEKIYKAAIKACRARPEEILYIDDRHDLTEAARGMGFETFTFRNNVGALKKRMKELGIL